MCQSIAEGGERCPHDSDGTRAVSYEAEREYGFAENFIRKVITVFRKEAIHNGISDSENASQEELDAFVAERKEHIENSENMSEPEKRTALRRWARAVKEKVSMATLYSWKKVSALMMAGSMAVMLSACTHSGENKTPEPGPEQTQTQTQNPTDGNKKADDKELSKQGAFGYDYSNVPIPEKIQKAYGKKASENILNDTFIPMEVMKSSNDLYKGGKQDPEKEFAPLKPFMTPEGWRQSIKKEKATHEAPVFTVYGSACQQDGSFPIVKKGKKGDNNESSYDKFTCDEDQMAVDKVKITNLKVSPYKKKKNDNLVNVKEHVMVTGDMSQVFTGKMSDGKQVSQELNTKFTTYLIPDGAKKDHWLIDGADYNYSFGKSSLQN